MSSTLPHLSPEHAAQVWRADELAASSGTVLASGHAALDAQLPGGGWPVGALIELLQTRAAQDEWRLLLPALVRQTQGVLVLVAPPQQPFAPALAAQGLDLRRLLQVQADSAAARVWACEQALRCRDVSAVLAWLPQVRSEQLRRLHFSAQTHQQLLFVMRPASTQTESSPATLRLLLEAPAAHSDALPLRVLKRRGPPLEQRLSLPARAARLQTLLAASRALAAQRRASPAMRSPMAPGVDHALDRPAKLSLSH